MNFWLSLRTAVESLVERRLRTALTTLGILIGIAAVILTVGLGEGAQSRVTSEIDALGTNLLIISPGSTTTGPVHGALGTAGNLTLTDANALGSKINCPDIAQVAPVLQGSQVLTAGSNNWTAPVVGTTPSYLTVRNRQVVLGSGLTASEVSSASRVAVVGSEVATSLFPGSSPVGQITDIAGIPFTIVGVLNPAGSSASTNLDNLAIVPISTAEQLFGRAGPFANSLSGVLVSSTSSATMGPAYTEAFSLLLQLHHVSRPSLADFTITPQTSLLSTASLITHTLTILLAGVATIALLVGGIGAMNIMLVSVTERVSEIGLRKALGATRSAILRQFLLEAILIGLAGGVFGVGLGLVGILVLPHLLGTSIVASSLAIVSSLVVATAIGLVFGVYPAMRAARLSPIVALRSE
ncbi:MAG: ABC transporter permease [Acidimicrobiales bacterium]